MAPKRLPASVIASAGMPSAAAAATTSSTRAMPSTMEYSVWRRRWTKRAADMRPQLSPVGEEPAQQRGAFRGQHPSRENPVVVPMGDGRQVHDAAARAGLGIGG